MGRRPSKCYRRLERAYTKKKYIKRYPRLPEGLERKFVFGNSSKFDFPARVQLVILRDGQIAERAILAIRILVNKELKLIEEGNYRLQVKSIPFHVIREHGLVGVAKAERMAKGMRLGFGRPKGRFARMMKGKVLLEILIDDNEIAYGICKRALQQAIKKLPLKWKIETKGVSFKNLTANPRLPKRKKRKVGGRLEIPREV